MARQEYGYTPPPTYGRPTGTSSGSGRVPGGIGGQRGPQNTNPKLVNVINQQPKPADLSGYYAQQQALINQQLAALQGYGSQVSALQQQINAGYAADPTARAMAQLKALFEGDPYAAERAQINQMMQPRQRLSRLVYGAGY